MTYTINEDRSVLTLHVTPEEQQALLELRSECDRWATTQAECEALESLIGNSALDWVNPVDTGDLTDAPLLGIMGEEGVADITVFLPNFGLVQTGSDGHNTLVTPILERWGFASYALRSFLEDLADDGFVEFSNHW